MEKDTYLCARHIWEAAQKIEREACAKLAEAAAKTMGDLGRQHRNRRSDMKIKVGSKEYIFAQLVIQAAIDIQNGQPLKDTMDDVDIDDAIKMLSDIFVRQGVPIPKQEK